MFGTIGKILGSGNVIEKGMDLIGSMHTSTQEEIEAKAKAKTDLLTAYAPFKLAQRLLALMFAFTFLLSYLICLAAVIHAWYDGTLLKTLQGGNLPVLVQGIVAVLQAFMLAWIMGTIVLFYFGGGAFEGFQERKRERETSVEKERHRKFEPPPGR